MTESLSRRHILLSNIGTNPPRVTTYQLGEESETSRFSAIALWKLLPEEQRPVEILYLLTPEAANVASEAIVNDAGAGGVPVQFLNLLGNDTPDDSREFLERVAAQIPEGCRLTLDVTQGLRHHAFLFYALALYLAEFRDIEIVGAWYCRWEISRDDNVPRPFIDLKPALELARWFHALAVFRETGSLREIARCMPDGEARDLTGLLSLFFTNGMPVEAGNLATRLLEAASERRLVTDVPLGPQLHALIAEEVAPLAGTKFDAQPAVSKECSKTAIPLTETELRRQAVFIDRYFRSGQLNLAFGLLREWMINWMALQSGLVETWLDRSQRESIEHRLGGLGEVYKAKLQDRKTYKHAPVRELLSEAQRGWANRWNRICDLRNALQHHGMKAAAFDPRRGDIDDVEQDWRQWESWGEPPDFGGGHGLLLICPIGLTPGVLYSAIRQTHPARVLVICSADSARAIDEALDRTGECLEVKRLLMANAFTGIDEFEPLIREASVWLFEADEIHANLTGGTTLMGVLVGELTKRAAREYQRPLREFVLIDKRLPEEQRADPWQLGDIHYLD